LIATRSLDRPVEGINDLVRAGVRRIESGLVAYKALQILRQTPADAAARADFEAHAEDLGYALLLKRYTPAVVDADQPTIQRAGNDLIPDVPVLFWAFRFMAGFGFYFILLFALAFYLASARKLETRWFLHLALWSLPLPWLAAELGWIVAEYGRQPWVVEGVLPTFLGVSSVSRGAIIGSLVGFVVFYSTLAVIDVVLMLRVIRGGPAPGPAAPQPALRPALAGED
jgi:cytochrome bd ubiquinol oxidase subunit I